MSMRNCCWRACGTTRSIWWVPPAATINGKPISEMRFDADHFLIDWERQQATCPEGHKSLSWTPAIDNRTNEVIKIKFSRHRLSSLSQPEALHAIAAPCAPHRHDPTTGAVRSFAGQAKDRSNRGLEARFTPLVQGSKGLFRRGFVPWDYAGLATLGKSARICNMWRQRLLSMSSVSSVG